MSENPSGDPVAQPPEDPIETEAGTPTDTELPEKVEWNGAEYDRDAVMEVVEKYGNWDKAQGAITQRNQALAEERRQVEAMQRELEEKIASLENPNTDSTQDDYDDVTRLTNHLNRIEGMLKPLIADQEAAKAELQLESELDNALAPFQNLPLANVDDMRSFMKKEGFKPDQADLAYRVMYNFDLGQIKGSQSVQQRREEPVMGSTGRGASPGWNAPTDAPHQRPMSEVSVEELVQRGVDDPDV